MSSSSRLISWGCSDDTRSRATSVSANTLRISVAKLSPSKSNPYDPNCVPVSTTSLHHGPLPA